MTRLITASPAAPLLSERGIGPVTAAVLSSHCMVTPGRVRSEAAFASLAGVSPSRVLRQHHPPSAEQGRRPTPQPGTAHGRHHTHARRSRNTRLPSHGNSPGTRPHAKIAAHSSATSRANCSVTQCAPPAFRLIRTKTPIGHRRRRPGRLCRLAVLAQYIKRWKESWAREEYLM